MRYRYNWTQISSRYQAIECIPKTRRYRKRSCASDAAAMNAEQSCYEDYFICCFTVVRVASDIRWCLVLVQLVWWTSATSVDITRWRYLLNEILWHRIGRSSSSHRHRQMWNKNIGFPTSLGMMLLCFFQVRVLASAVVANLFVIELSTAHAGLKDKLWK
jgi:hypothetical protein